MKELKSQVDVASQRTKASKMLSNGSRVVASSEESSTLGRVVAASPPSEAQSLDQRPSTWTETLSKMC